jgi:hypothetical protein
MNTAGHRNARRYIRLFLYLFIAFLVWTGTASAQAWPGKLGYTKSTNYSSIGGCNWYTTSWSWTYTDASGKAHPFGGPSQTIVQTGHCKGVIQIPADEWSEDQLYYLQATAQNGSLTAVRGYVEPKYKVVGVVFSVPGTQSYVSYNNTTMMGTSTSTAGSFSTNVATSVSISQQFGCNVCGVKDGAFTGTTTTSYTQESDTSASWAVSQSTSLQNKWSPLTGPSLDHANDVVYVWLNPEAWYTLYPGGPTNILWNGYTYNLADDADNMEVYPIHLKDLLNPNGIAGLDAYTQGRFSRVWAPNNTDGSGPGLTNQDLLNIAAADPFSNPNYTLSLGSDGKTSTDSRFTLTPNNIYQVPGGTNTYTWTYTTTATQGQGAKSTYSDSFALEEKFTADLVIASFTFDLKKSTTFTWTDQWNILMSSMMSQSAMVSINGAGAQGTTEFTVWQDNVYGTFMVYPVPPT